MYRPEGRAGRTRKGCAMDERRWERLGATYGVAFSLLFLASLLLAPVPPHLDAGIDKITAYFTDNRTRVLTGQLLMGLSVPLLLLFLGHLRHVLARAERNTEAIAPVVTLSGVAASTLLMLSLLPGTLLGIMAGQGALTNDALIRAVYDLAWITTGVTELAAALFLATAGYAMVKGELVDPWLGFLGIGLSIALLATGMSAFYLGSHEAFWFAMQFVCGVGFAVWTLTASGIMLARPEQTRIVERTPILEPMRV